MTRTTCLFLAFGVSLLAACSSAGKIDTTTSASSDSGARGDSSSGGATCAATVESYCANTKNTAPCGQSLPDFVASLEADCPESASESVCGSLVRVDVEFPVPGGMTYWFDKDTNALTAIVVHAKPPAGCIAGPAGFVESSSCAPGPLLCPLADAGHD